MKKRNIMKIEKIDELAMALRVLAEARIGIKEVAALATIGEWGWLTYAEISEKLGISRQAAKMRMHILRQKQMVVTIIRYDGVPITKLSDTGNHLLAKATQKKQPIET